MTRGTTTRRGGDYPYAVRLQSLEHGGVVTCVGGQASQVKGVGDDTDGNLTLLHPDQELCRSTKLASSDGSFHHG